MRATLVAVTFVAMVACAKQDARAQDPPFGDYLGSFERNGYKARVWRFRDGDKSCYTVLAYEGTGLSCVVEK